LDIQRRDYLRRALDRDMIFQVLVQVLADIVERLAIFLQAADSRSSGNGDIPIQ
jgi:hypothetical protein